MDENINCLCGGEYTQKDFKKHYTFCNVFKERFSNFDLKMTMLLKNNTKEDLLFIQILLKRYIKIISNLLNENYGYKKNKFNDEINNYNYCNKNQNFIKNINKIPEDIKKPDVKVETKTDKTTINDITNRSAAFLPVALSDENYLKNQDTKKDENYFYSKYREIII